MFNGKTESLSIESRVSKLEKKLRDLEDFGEFEDWLDRKFFRLSGEIKRYGETPKMGHYDLMFKGMLAVLEDRLAKQDGLIRTLKDKVVRLENCCRCGCCRR